MKRLIFLLILLSGAVSADSTTTTHPPQLRCYNESSTPQEMEIGAQLTDVLACKLLRVKDTSISPIYTLVFFSIIFIAACGVIVITIIVIGSWINHGK